MTTIISDKNEVIRMLKDGKSLENHFLKGFSFENEIFDYDVNFSGATIDSISFEGASFGTKKFPKYAYFINTKFINNLEFSDNDIKFNFSNATFSDTADFNNAQFGIGILTVEVNYNNLGTPRQYAVFYKTKFLSTANFTNVNFFSIANFNDAIFFSITNFTNAKFYFFADFTNAHFGTKDEPQYIDFYNTEFFDNTKFIESQFFRKATDIAENDDRKGFTNTTFNKVVDFSKAIFSNAYFNNVKFFSKTSFNNATFSEETKFIKQDLSSNEVEIYFNEVSVNPENLKDSEKFQFQFNECDLSKTSFIEMDLSRINFTKVTWAKTRIKPIGIFIIILLWISILRKLLFFKKLTIKNKLYKIEKFLLQHITKNEDIFTRKYLYDEKLFVDNNMKFSELDKLDKLDKLNKLRELYNKLNYYYETKREYDDAGHFHYGEMEMIRLRYESNSYQIYKFLSGYGTRTGQSLIVLILIVLILGVLHLFTGLKVGGEKEWASFEYVLVLNPINWFQINWLQTFSDFVKSCVYSLHVATFIEDLNLKTNNLNAWGMFICLLDRIFIPLQATFFIFTIKRKIGRQHQEGQLK